MWLETNRLIIRSIQRGDEIIFSGMSQDGSWIVNTFSDKFF